MQQHQYSITSISNNGHIISHSNVVASEQCMKRILNDNDADIRINKPYCKQFKDCIKLVVYLMPMYNILEEDTCKM